MTSAAARTKLSFLVSSPHHPDMIGTEALVNTCFESKVVSVGIAKTTTLVLLLLFHMNLERA